MKTDGLRRIFSESVEITVKSHYLTIYIHLYGGIIDLKIKLIVKRPWTYLTQS